MGDQLDVQLGEFQGYIRLKFAGRKEVDRVQRLIIDGRPVNEYFLSPPFEFTSGEDLSRLQVELGYVLQAAKCDLSDFSTVARLPKR